MWYQHIASEVSLYLLQGKIIKDYSSRVFQRSAHYLLISNKQKDSCISSVMNVGMSVSQSYKIVVVQRCSYRFVLITFHKVSVCSNVWWL